MTAGIPATLGGAEHLAQPRARDGRPDQAGRLLGRDAGRRRGDHVHDRADHGHRGGGPVGDQLGHAGQASVLHGQAGELAVDRDQLAEHRVLPAEVTLAARIGDMSDGSRKPFCHD
jgi:hypothetical protein